MLEDRIVGLPVEERGLEGNAYFFRDRRRDSQVSLVDLGEPGVDDLLVELLLFLEAKDLASLFGEHIGDSIEGDVMEVGIVDRDGVNRGAELSSQGECRDQAPETLMGSVQRHQDGAIPDSSVRGFDDQGIHLRTAHDALADRSDQAGLDCPETLGAQDEEVVVPALGFLQNHAIVAALVGEA